MKKLNVPTAIIFGLLSLVNVATGDWLAATASGLLAAGFLLSDLAYAPALAPGTAAAPLPAWRRYGSVVLVGAALLVLGYQISHDIRAKLQRDDAPRERMR